MNQPLTLDEVQDIHTYPLLIHRLIEYSHPDNDFDYIVLIIHALMLENGFQLVTLKHFICSYNIFYVFVFLHHVLIF